MHNAYATVTIALTLICGCGRTQDTKTMSSSQSVAPVLKVKVFADGTISANDKPVVLEQLAEQMSELQKSGATVWYYREAAGEEPHENAMRVMGLVVNNELPVSFSTKPDFSDAVGPDGIPHPR